MRAVHQFANCSVFVDTDNQEGWPCPGLARIDFPDGTWTSGRPHLGDENYHSHAERAGYGSAMIGPFCIEHELAHVFVAEAMGLPYSPVQWRDAHGIPWQEHYQGMLDEERVARWWQRAYNRNDYRPDKLKPLLDAGCNLDELAQKWRALIVEMFGCEQWWTHREVRDWVANG